MKKLLLLLTLGIVMLNVVYAAEDDNFLDYIFKPLGGVDIAATYNNYQYVIDTIVYFIFFVATASVTLQKRFKGNAGRAMSIVIGIMLAIGMSVFAKAADFTLGSLWPIAAGAFIGVLAFLIFRLMVDNGAKLGGGVSTAYVITFFVIQGLIPELAGSDGWIAEKTPVIWGIANLMLLIAIVLMIGEITKWFGKGGPWGGDGRSGDRSSRPSSGRQQSGQQQGQQQGQRQPVQQQMPGEGQQQPGQQTPQQQQQQTQQLQNSIHALNVNVSQYKTAAHNHVTNLDALLQDLVNTGTGNTALRTAEQTAMRAADDAANDITAEINRIVSDANFSSLDSGARTSFFSMVRDFTGNQIILTTYRANCANWMNSYAATGVFPALPALPGFH